MTKLYPCDYKGSDGQYHCPYGGDEHDVDCHNMCGLGADETEYETETED